MGLSLPIIVPPKGTEDSPAPPVRGFFIFKPRDVAIQGRGRYRQAGLVDDPLDALRQLTSRGALGGLESSSLESAY